MNFHKFREANFHKFLVFILILAFLLPCLFLLAEEEEDLQELCQLEKIEADYENLEPGECRKLLEKCEKYWDQEYARIGEEIAKTEKEKQNLQNTIYTLGKKIKNLEYQIYKSNIVIKDLSLQIKDIQYSVETTSLKIEATREKLANILRSIYEEDQRSLVEILLAGNLSDFFDNLVALEALNFQNQELLAHIKTLKSYLENQKQSLDEEKDNLEKQVLIQTLQKQESAKTKKEKEYLLQLTEAEYQKYLKEKTDVERRAQEIRSRIFELIGVPEAPTFGEALEIAKFVESMTGIRPAFLLAVLTQESNIGKNVGQCFLVNPETGEGIRAKTGEKEPRTMKPDRDVPHFLNICKSLGRDPLNTPVSCPMRYGWGGAMGPAQFIPSTWMRYKDRITQLKRGLADPWDIRDAFLAAAVYLADLGATKRTYEYEWCATISYFAGSCSLRNQTRYRFYGNSVMAIASQYEKDIAELQKAQ